MKTHLSFLCAGLLLAFPCLSPAASAQGVDFGKDTLVVPVISNVIAKEAMNSLQIRLGDLRHMSDPAARHGFWARGYGEDIDLTDFINADITLWGGEAGYDYLLKNTGRSRLYIGAMGGFAGITDFKTDQDKLERYSQGDAQSPVVGVYAAWLHDNGWFADLTARYLHTTTNATIYPAELKAEEKRDFFGATFEIGKEWRKTLSDVSFLRIEPKMEWTYFRGEKGNYSSDAYTHTDYDATQYLAGRAGVLLGYVHQMKNGLKLEPFLEAGYTYAPKGKTDIRYIENSNKGILEQDTSDMTGSAWDISAGVNWQLGKQLYLYASAGYENGGFLDKVQGRLGIRGTFGHQKPAAKSPAPVPLGTSPAATPAQEPAAAEALQFNGLALFPFNKTQVPAAYDKKIQDAARQIKTRPYKSVLVTGHTDNVGTLEINRTISLKRARAVADKLREQGIRSEALQTQGKAYLEPVAGNNTAAGRAKNRRVDVSVK